MTEKIIFSWSGGKDSAAALHSIIRSGKYEVIALLTTLTKEYGRINMHGVRRELLELQAKSIGMPLEKVFISKESPNEEYENAMGAALQKYRRQGVGKIGIGDIFLEDLRKYREDKLAAIGMMGIFPLWRKDTGGLARNFIKEGFEAVITCVDSTVLGKSFAGRKFDLNFLDDLPDNVDPCGENGEFHSFVHNGPIFREPVRIRKGEIVLREGRFYFCDLLPD